MLQHEKSAFPPSFICELYDSVVIILRTYSIILLKY